MKITNIKTQRFIEQECDKIWYVYIIRCKRGLYTGITLDVEARVKRHNAGKGAKSVRALGLPAFLVYTEEVGSHGKALKREIEIKKMTKKMKEELVKKLDS